MVHQDGFYRETVAEDMNKIAIVICASPTVKLMIHACSMKLHWCPVPVVQNFKDAKLQSYFQSPFVKDFQEFCPVFGVKFGL